MNATKLNVLFYLNKAKTNQKGLCPLYCRLTFLKKRKQFSTGQFVKPTNWDAKKQIVFKRSTQDQYLNAQLDLISDKINKTFLSLQLKSSDFTVEDIFREYFGKVQIKEDSIVNYFRRYLKKQSKLIGKDLKQVTWNKFNYVCNHLESFIKYKYLQNDYPLKELNLQFLNEFEFFLKTIKNQKQVTINKSIQRLRKPVSVAVAEGYLDKDPFLMYKTKHVKKEVVFLSIEELKLLEEYKFAQARLSLVQDLFIFCCYTGLAYNEMAHLKKEHLIVGFDKNLWIQMKREKTNRLISIPLLGKANEIINKYESHSEYVLPEFSNQKINSYLKEMAGILGIKKSISHHTARKTFASTVLLYNDVPIEIVSELLGHSSIQITQEYYGKIVQKKISEAMIDLKRKIDL